MPEVERSGIGPKSIESGVLNAAHGVRNLNAGGARTVQGLFNLLNTSQRLADNGRNSPEEAIDRVHRALCVRRVCHA